MKIRKFFTNEVLVLSGFILLGILMYGFIIKQYFFQDDFFHLNITQTSGSWGEFIKLISFRKYAERGEIYFYRPVFREVLFNIYCRIFGINPLPFRLTHFLIFLSNIILAYLAVGKIVKNKIAGFGAAFLTAISAANIGILGNLAAGIQTTGMAFFALLSIILFNNYLVTKKIKFKIFSFLTFVLAFFSQELAVGVVPVLAMMIWLKNCIANNANSVHCHPGLDPGSIQIKKQPELQIKSEMTLERIVKELWLYIFVVAIVFIAQVKIIGLPVGEAQYSLAFSPLKIANSVVWYFLWALGIPEMLLDYIGPGVKINPNLFKYWGNYFNLIFPIFALILLTLIKPLSRQIKNKYFWFLVIWFVSGILLVLTVPAHKSICYLPLSLPALGGILGLMFSKSKPAAVGAAAALLVILNYTSLDLGKKTNWMITRSKIAENLIRSIKSSYPVIPDNKSVYLINDSDYPVINQDWGGSSSQASVVLSGSNALKVIYKKPGLRVYYEDFGNPPDENYVTIKAVIRID